MWLLLLLVLPVVLYLFRHRAKRQAVSTLLFFKALSKEHQESAWLRRVKRLLSLLLSLLVIAAVAGALARPVVAPRAGGVRSVVVLVDRSASMAAPAALAEGPSRLAHGLAEVERRLSGLPASVAVSVVTYDVRPRVLQPPTRERRDVRRVLDTLASRPIEDDPRPALRLAERIASLDVPAEVWHVTDETAAVLEETDNRIWTSLMSLRVLPRRA